MEGEGRGEQWRAACRTSGLSKVSGSTVTALAQLRGSEAKHGEEGMAAGGLERGAGVQAKGERQARGTAPAAAARYLSHGGVCFHTASG